MLVLLFLFLLLLNKSENHRSVQSGGRRCHLSIAFERFFGLAAVVDVVVAIVVVVVAVVVVVVLLLLPLSC